MAYKGKVENNFKGKKAARSRRSSSLYYSREIRRRFLIVCEGKETEPNYFKELETHLKPGIAIIATGAGMNTLSLVSKAEQEKKRMERSHQPPDVVWVVMDKDDFQSDNFDNAIKRCDSLKFECGWSNECFELWILLHYKNVTAAKPRKNIYQELSKIFGFNYEKTGKGKALYSLVRETGGDEKIAIQFAEQLVKRASYPPSKSNPCTQIHLLVKDLNKYKS